MKLWRIRKSRTSRGGQNQVSVYNLLGIVILGFLKVGIAGQPPEISFSASAIFPRLYMVEEEEALFWRTTLDVDQKFSKALRFSMSLAGTPESLVHDQVLQVYNASLILDRGALKFRLGRFTDWNAFSFLRIDGMRLDLRTKGIGNIALGGGMKSEFLSTRESLPAYFLEWTKKMNNLVLSGRMWSLDERSYLGTQFSTSFAGFRVNGLAGYNLTDSTPSYTRLGVVKRFGKHRFNLGYRQFRKSYFYSYPWDEDEGLELPPILSAGYRILLGEARVGLENYTRLSDEGASFLRFNFGWHGLSTSVHMRTAGSSKLTGGSIGWQGHLKQVFRFGVSGSINSVEYDGISIPKRSSGLYGWVAWQPGDLFAIRIFARTSQNGYYELDGRGGVSIRVAF